MRNTTLVPLVTLVIILTFAALLAGCTPGGGATPALIGSFPQASPPIPTPNPIVNSPDAAAEVTFVIAVSDLTTARRTALELGESVDGYGDDWGASSTDADSAIVILHFRSYDFNWVADQLRYFGTVNAEIYPDGFDSTFLAGDNHRIALTVLFTTGKADGLLPFSGLPGTHLLDTLRGALSVAALIYTIVIDAAIWVIVLAGPPTLVGLAMRCWFRRSQPANVEKEK